MCVNKVIAEPERRGARGTKQGGLRGNTIAFPQGKVDILPSSELPAPADVCIVSFSYETVQQLLFSFALFCFVPFLCVSVWFVLFRALQ